VPLPSFASVRPLFQRRGCGCGFAIFGGVLLLLAIVAGFLVPPFWRLASHFSDLTYRQPSRLYAQAVHLTRGALAPAEPIVALLHDEGYAEDATSPALPAGRYRRTPSGLMVHLRSLHLPDGETTGGTLEVVYAGGPREAGDKRKHSERIERLVLDDQAVSTVTLEPMLLACFYGPDLQERRAVALGRVAKDLVNAILAAEDDSFFTHAGISPSGMLRALWVNLRGGEVKQGGSTLTQQLVKNLYLTHQRTFARKMREILLAVVLDLRYDKRQIIEAYLNEIYMGGSGGVSLLGVGAASRAFFGKDPDQLDLAEAATLAGLIRSPANYSPLAHPDRALERRNWVLKRMQELRLADPERVAAALAEPLGAAPESPARKRAPYFADAAAAEASRRYGLEDLADGGYAIFSTLDWRSQRTAQEAIEWGIAASEQGYQKGAKGKGPLQAALVSLDPRDGGIRAYIGGRQYDSSQFDRAGQAQRQVGSAFKPIVYAALFESGEATPASFIDDEPLTFALAGQDEPWEPKNDDEQYHGWVSVRTALEKSYNLATLRLALKVGMNRIVDLAHDMGVTSKIHPYPSLALGAAEISPLELATAYGTLAAGGVRPPVHGLDAVLDRRGQPVEGVALPTPKRVLSPQSTYMVTSLMQGVLQRGTAAGAASGIAGDLAGKTGTTNKRRDSWFAGFARERTTVVWVGYDNNATTRLSGARAALPIWVRFMAKSAPAAGYSSFIMPPGLTTALIDPTTGLLATEYCPTRLTEVFRAGEVPAQPCDRHQTFEEGQVAAGGQEAPGANPGESGTPAPSAEEGGRLRRWLRRVFGRDRQPPPPPPPSPPPGGAGAGTSDKSPGPRPPG
jgi:penicillin-binding protein 1B